MQILLACEGHPSSSSEPINSNNNSSQIRDTVKSKPGASFSDTLLIKENSVVVFNPDSAQLLAIKAINKPMIFNSMTHELFYQIRNAKMVIRQYWTQLQIIETNHARFLRFEQCNHTVVIVDLNTINDISGMFLFNTKKPPKLIDMMNIDSELNFYFN